jgi:alanine-alpha-ketoisovalerate/valine-pyruvate aminotransferase
MLETNLKALIARDEILKAIEHNTPRTASIGNAAMDRALMARMVKRNTPLNSLRATVLQTAWKSR